jgi:uncharacterized membrane protein (UPF0127 family)
VIRSSDHHFEGQPALHVADTDVTHDSRRWAATAQEKWSRPVRQRIPRETTLLASNNAVVCERCVLADRPLARMRGLLGRRELASEEGILLQPASSVHTWFMRFPIDVVFLDREMSVVRVVPRLAPWRLASRRRAAAVLELAAGESERRGIEVGHRLSWASA